jgi:PHD/YefM family antitoxin component YafN of YafNO toxin-antitoxin module
MQNTNPKALRAEMKDYLELAAKEPVRIQRRSGESFILMNEARYLEMQNELISLQRRLLGMSQIVAGHTREYVPGDKSRINRLKKKS